MSLTMICVEQYLLMALLPHFQWKGTISLTCPFNLYVQKKTQFMRIDEWNVFLVGYCFHMLTIILRFLAKKFVRCFLVCLCGPLALPSTKRSPFFFFFWAFTDNKVAENVAKILLEVSSLVRKMDNNLLLCGYMSTIKAEQYCSTFELSIIEFYSPMNNSSCLLWDV